MLKLMLTGAVAAGALLAVSASARAADAYTFALVPKNTNNPFFDQALAGCKKAEKPNSRAPSSACTSDLANMAAGTRKRRS